MTDIQHFIAVIELQLLALLNRMRQHIKSLKYNNTQRLKTNCQQQKNWIFMSHTVSVHQSFKISISPWLSASITFGMISFWTRFRKLSKLKVGSTRTISVRTSLISVDLNMPPNMVVNRSVMPRVALTIGLSLSSYWVLYSNNSSKTSSLILCASWKSWIYTLIYWTYY